MGSFEKAFVRCLSVLLRRTVNNSTSFRQDDFAQKDSSIFSDSRSSFDIFPNRTSRSSSHDVGIHRCTNLETVQKFSGQHR